MNAPTPCSPPGSGKNSHRPEAFLEGLTSRELGNAAVGAAEGIAWTSLAESALVRWIIADTSQDLASSAIRSAAVNGAFGLYDGFVSTTGAGDAYLLLTGRDHFGKRQPKWRRIMAAVGMGSQAILHLHGSEGARAFGTSSTRAVQKRFGAPKLSQVTLTSSAGGRGRAG